ncbi:ubiquitin-like-conjugating enzyme ATG10, partial [Notothenia coriiceps]|uniref:Ubiquitin-like-conjugating enzyme ATG10 n=1 Tax=Notothenia coriiceps TaxID=8208 RepID=A0A6I9NT28_9TELE
MSLCVLDEDKFHLCCQLLLQLSEQLGDGWSWEGGQEGYLRKTALRSVVIDSSSVWDYEGGGADTSCPSRSEQQEGEQEQAAVDASADTDSIKGDMEDEDDDDGVCVASAGSSQLLQYEYNILHSCSYSTPVLYFRACTQEGRSLSLEEVWSSVHPNYRLRLQNSPLNTITLQVAPEACTTKPVQHNLDMFELPGLPNPKQT